VKRLLAACSALLAAPAAGEPYPPLDFALYVGHADIRFAYPAADVDTAIRRIGVGWREHYGERLRLGLFGGYSFVSQTGNAPTAGLDLDGYHVGVSFDLDLLQRRPFAIFAGASYMYERAKQEDATNHLRLTWTAPTVRVGALIRISETLRLTGGGQYGYVEGEERLRGSVNQTSRIERRHETGGFAALELTVDAQRGYVGIAGYSGAERGGTIYFGRQF